MKADTRSNRGASVWDKIALIGFFPLLFFFYKVIFYYRETMMGLEQFLIFWGFVLVLNLILYVFWYKTKSRLSLLLLLELATSLIFVFFFLNYNLSSNSINYVSFYEFEYGTKGRRRSNVDIPYFDIERFGIEKRVYFFEEDPENIRGAKGIILGFEEGYFGYEVIVHKEIEYYR